MPGVPPDALDQVKKAFKGMFRNRKKPGDEHHEGTHAYEATSTQPEAQRPTSTQPAAPTAAEVPAPSSAKDEESQSSPPARPHVSNASSPVPAPGTAPVADHTAPSKSSVPLRPAPPTVESTDDIDLPTTKKTTSSLASTGPPATSPVPPTTKTERVPGMSATSGPLEDNPEYTQ